MTRILKIDAGVRYWEDTEINGEIDIEDVNENIPPKMPCAKFIEGEWRWCPEIDAETGKILNWEQGVYADVHYKVCDDCKIDYVKDGIVVCNNDDYYYCPDFLCPKEGGYGDYIIMDIDKNGQILDWNVEDVKNWVNGQANKERKDYF